MQNKTIILLAGKDASTNIVYNALSKHHLITKVILENKVPYKHFIKRRLKKLGYTTVFGQILFQALIAKPLAIFSKAKISNILNANNLSDAEIDAEKVININSVNDSQTISLLQVLKPDIIIVNGTRIISKKILQSTTAKFINMHAGITPKYRGVHGGYWALVNKDKENCGVTVHFVDEGIDTGEIIAQQIITPQRQDNFITYPIHQVCIGVNLLQLAIVNCLNNSVTTKKTGGESNLFYHPTIWQYLYKRITVGVK